MNDEEPSLNLTPLIDVVFLLLIFFMVSTSFVRDAELQTRIARSARGEMRSVPDDGIEVVIDANGLLFYR
jgi:biopolymer transport protein ExbD